MKTRIISLIAIIAMSFAVNAQIDRSKMPKPGPEPKIELGKVDKFTLANGLQVIMVKNNKLPRASASLTIDNKPILEGEKAGVLSALGSLLGNGTTNITKDKFNEQVDYMGASISFGSSGASAASLKRYFTDVMQLMADGIKNPIFSKDEFDKHIKRTLEGLKNNEKNVTSIARRVESALTYGKNHPYGEFITEKTVKNITLDDVKKYYNMYYKPNNAYLVIIGDINKKETKKLVTNLFGDWKPGVIPTATIQKPTNPKSTEINFVDMPNAVQSEIAVINNIDLTLGDKDYYATLLANQILGGGATARLFQNLREDKAYTYGAYSGISQSRYAGTFKASSSVRNTVTDSAMVEIQKEINKIRHQPVSAEELKNAKAEYVGSFVMNVQKPQVAAGFALNIARYNLPENFYENYLKNINAVTLKDVQNAAIKYFKVNKARIIITGKAKDFLKNLEKTSNYPIKYFDKYANPTEKPAMNKKMPVGITKETVLNKYFDAIGGKDKIKNLKSTMVVYEAEVMGTKMENTEKRVADKYVNLVATGGNVVMKVVMDKNNVKMNGQALPPAMAKEMSYMLGTFAEMGFLQSNEAKLTGIEVVNGKDAYVISKKGNIVSTSSYYDVNSGLKVKETQTTVFGGQTQNQEATFSDYKEFNGIKFPGKKTGSLGPQKVSYTIKDAKVNSGVSDEDFK